MNKILIIVMCIIVSVINTYAANGYIFPDYHRLLLKGKAFTINLGIYPDGNLFLKCNESEYRIHDLDAFKRGTEQAMEDTQALQRGGEDSANFFKSRANESNLLLYNSSSVQDKSGYFTLVFDHHSNTNQYPIKITFHNSIHQPQSFDFPPGELQYLQKKIDIILENKEEYITKAKLIEERGR